MALNACCSSRVKFVSGTSFEAGRTATVERLVADRRFSDPVTDSEILKASDVLQQK